MAIECGKDKKGDVASSARATDAQIAVVPRIGMSFSYLRL
jgi:hypothetical protein